jgi:pimeloyl-ACP methyl ester carboxylesterase
VFVHGLAGSPQDFRRYRNFLSHNAPTNTHQLHLLSAANEQDTYVDISVMAKNLAREVQQYLRQRSENIDRISFICHSLGGLIARRAVMEFDKDMRGKLHAYISLATPHLGLRYNRNTILRPLLWLAGTWTKSRSLSQLKMEDHRDPRQSFLYEMSKSPALGWFRHVRFVASPQDAYVPIYSAMAEADPIAISDSKLGTLIMVCFDSNNN